MGWEMCQALLYNAETSHPSKYGCFVHSNQIISPEWTVPNAICFEPWEAPIRSTSAGTSFSTRHLWIWLLIKERCMTSRYKCSHAPFNGQRTGIFLPVMAPCMIGLFSALKHHLMTANFPIATLQSIEKLWSCLPMMTTTTTLSIISFSVKLSLIKKIAQKIGSRCRYSSWINDDWSVFCIATPSDESKFQLQYSSIHIENEKLPSYDEDTNYPFNLMPFCEIISYEENCPEKIGSQCHYSSRTNAQISVHSITSAILWIFCLHTPWSKIQSFPIHEINARLSSTKC